MKYKVETNILFFFSKEDMFVFPRFWFAFFCVIVSSSSERDALFVSSLIGRAVWHEGMDEFTRYANLIKRCVLCLFGLLGYCSVAEWHIHGVSSGIVFLTAKFFSEKNSKL